MRPKTIDCIKKQIDAASKNWIAFQIFKFASSKTTAKSKERPMGSKSKGPKWDEKLRKSRKLQNECETQPIDRSLRVTLKTTFLYPWGPQKGHFGSEVYFLWSVTQSQISCILFENSFVLYFDQIVSIVDDSTTDRTISTRFINLRSNLESFITFDSDVLRCWFCHQSKALSSFDWFSNQLLGTLLM